MDIEEIRHAINRSPLTFKIAPLFTLLGVAIIVTALILGVIVGVTAADYYGADKASRDAAGPGSSLLDDLSFTNSIPAWLLPFSFVGMAFLLIGIGLSFATIVSRVRLRASAMELVLPKAIQARQKSS